MGTAPPQLHWPRGLDEPFASAPVHLHRHPRSAAHRRTRDKRRRSGAEGDDERAGGEERVIRSRSGLKGVVGFEAPASRPEQDGGGLDAIGGGAIISALFATAFYAGLLINFQ